MNTDGGVSAIALGMKDYLVPDCDLDWTEELSGYKKNSVAQD